MTFTPVRYKSYEEYLSANLSDEGNFRLLSTGEIIQLPPEDAENLFLASELVELLKRLSSNRRLVRTSTEIQVNPIGDGRVNRVPDLVVLLPEHLTLMAQLKKSVILLGSPPPLLVAEVVSPGSASNENYRRDYEWKRQQYEQWQIPEYWIIDRHRAQVTILTLTQSEYQETRYINEQLLQSTAFPTLSLSAKQLLSGEML